MKNFLLLSLLIVTILFSGCAKMYVDVKTDNAATLQLVPQSKTLVFADVMYAKISDYSKGCQDMVELGVFATDSDTPSKRVKISAEVPLLIQSSYMYNNVSENIDFVLRPQKNKHYVIEYVKKEVNDKTITDFYVYMKEGQKNIEIPKKRIRDFNYRECM